MSKIFKAFNVKYDEENVVKIDTLAKNSNYDEILPGEENIDPFYEVKREADRIKHEAELDAAKIWKKAKNEAEAIIEGAKLEGSRIFEESRDEGYKQGYSEGVKASENLKKEAEKTLENAKITREQIISSIEGEMVAIISKIVYKLINCTADVNSKVIVGLIHQGFKEATLVGDIKIHVSKEDFDDVFENADEIAAKARGGVKIDFIKNLSLNKNDCIIETPYGNIDCSLEQQYQSLKNNLYAILAGEPK